MKRIILLLILLGLFSFLLAQNKDVTSEIKEKYRNVKMLKSIDIEEVKIDLRRPDNTATMPRKETEFSFVKKIEIKSKIVKSNKQLY